MKYPKLALKTLKDIEDKYLDCTPIFLTKTIRQEAIKTIKNLRTNDTISPILIEKFPDNMKGSIIKDKFRDGIVTLSMEYGMIMMLMHFFNIKEEDIK